MKWYVVYRRKPFRGTLQENLEKAGISYFVPIYSAEKLNEGEQELTVVQETAISNLVFVHTDRSIWKVVAEVDGLRNPMIDCMTQQPAVVLDHEMERFRRLVNLKTHRIQILKDNYSQFRRNQRVRIRAGIFEGLEGRVVRILRDRKLVISLGTMAVAISGMDRSLFEPVD